MLGGFAALIGFADVTFVTAVTNFGAQQTFYTRSAGFQFTNNSQQPIVVTQLGRWVLSGNTQTHVLRIISPSQVTLASVTINTSGAPVGFLYGALTPSYTIAPGDVVLFTSDEMMGGDNWYDNNNTVINILPALGYVQSAYVAGGSIFLTGNNGGTYTSAVPVTFKFSSSPRQPTGARAARRTRRTASLFGAVGDLRFEPQGDTVKIPPGLFTYSQLTVNNAITLTGDGPASTTINISPSSPTFSSGGAIAITAAATVRGFTMTQPGGITTTGIKADTANGWRITNITYNSAAVAGYFVYFADKYGLIDNCTINGGSGSDEWIFGRGPSTSWQTASTLGTSSATYIENCVFNLQGYPDFNANSRGVIRFCTINGTTNTIKLDGHGYATNSPPRSFRELELYGNTWNSNSGFASFEIRGGSAMIFDNVNLPGVGGFYLTDYCYQTNLTNLGHQNGVQLSTNRSGRHQGKPPRRITRRMSGTIHRADRLGRARSPESAWRRISTPTRPVIRQARLRSR